MAFIDEPYKLLAEAAEADLNANTEGALTESAIRSTLQSIEETSEPVVVTAEMVSVVRVGEDLLVEMNCLHPYMKCNGIKSIAEALDNVAIANQLEPKAVGLLIESDQYYEALLEKCCKKGKSAKNSILNKIEKATKVSKKLKEEGFCVKKKKRC